MDVKTAENYLDSHYISRSNWLRAAVLGANDGILSVSSIAVGIAASDTGRTPVILATLAGLVAGAFAMAAGEYVSVSSQSDIEKGDIERERRELAEDPEFELEMLTQIYERRGLKRTTAETVARELTQKDALAAHVRDELGISETSQANPLQAAAASGASFTAGALLPLFISLVSPITTMQYWLYGTTLAALGLLGILSAKTGGSSIEKSFVRIVLWGAAAMAVSALVGHIFGARIG